MIHSACCGMLHFSIYFCRNSKKRETTEKSYTIKKLFNWKKSIAVVIAVDVCLQ